MRSLLHILTKPDDVLAREVIRYQARRRGSAALPAERSPSAILPGEESPAGGGGSCCSAPVEIKVIDLTQSEPDYDDLLNEIFKADSVQVW